MVFKGYKINIRRYFLATEHLRGLSTEARQMAHGLQGYRFCLALTFLTHLSNFFLTRGGQLLMLAGTAFVPE